MYVCSVGFLQTKEHKRGPTYIIGRMNYSDHHRDFKSECLMMGQSLVHWIVLEE